MLDPVTVKRGQKIVTTVRDFFKKGVKSSNKTYAKDAPDKEQRDRRNDNQPIALEKRGNVSFSIKFAEWLNSVKPQDRAGNCGEMAALSAWLAMTEYKVERERLFQAQLCSPADHAFCLEVNEPPDKFERDWTTAVDFVKDARAKDWLIMDPWLNLCCRGDQYLELAAKKLEEWTADGKRIQWKAPNTEALGWHVPTGAYASAFKKAPVSLDPLKD